MPQDHNLVRLSKFLALILRHQPERFGLELDREGWAPLSRVVETLEELPNFRWADRSDIVRVVQEGTGNDKRRFEIQDDRIRARYGHSLDRRIQYTPAQPPRMLYHGTSPEALETIRHEGLRPVGRQYVHLSADRETAIAVGARHTAQPVVVTVRAAAASDAGIAFFHPEKRVYLAEPIPPTFLDLDD
jgi:putative RNA 2'-phosphotransferase